MKKGESARKRRMLRVVNKFKKEMKSLGWKMLNFRRRSKLKKRKKKNWRKNVEKQKGSKKKRTRLIPESSTVNTITIRMTTISPFWTVLRKVNRMPRKRLKDMKRLSKKLIKISTRSATSSLISLWDSSIRVRASPRP